MSIKLYDNIIYNLNIDLSREYAGIIQYNNHASKIKDSNYYMSEKLKKISTKEHEHAFIISSIIQSLGGSPTDKVEYNYISSQSNDMTKHDLQLSYNAIISYLQRIRQLKNLGLYNTVDKIKSIIGDEKEHALYFENVLGIKGNKIY